MEGEGSRENKKILVQRSRRKREMLPTPHPQKKKKDRIAK